LARYLSGGNALRWFIPGRCNAWHDLPIQPQTILFQVNFSFPLLPFLCF
jgi:hypothetical protein